MSSARYWMTPTARAHYFRAVVDTLERWGAEQAQRYRSELLAGFQYVADNQPRLRSPHHEALAAGSGFNLYPVAHRYVVYQSLGNDVIVAAIFHESMDIPVRLRSLQRTSREEIAALRANLGKPQTP